MWWGGLKGAIEDGVPVNQYGLIDDLVCLDWSNMESSC